MLGARAFGQDHLEYPGAGDPGTLPGGSGGGPGRGPESLLRNQGAPEEGSGGSGADPWGP